MRFTVFTTCLGLVAMACGASDNQKSSELQGSTGGAAGSSSTTGGSASAGKSGDPVSSGGDVSSSSGGANSNSAGGRVNNSAGGSVSNGGSLFGSGGKGTSTSSGGKANASSGGSGNNNSSGGATSAGAAGATASAGAAGSYTVEQVDLCANLISDQQAHPMTSLTKPAVGATVVDKEFGTTIRRISSVATSGSNPVIKPMYTTVSAWNADESKLILYQVGAGHQLYDGKTYARIGTLDIDPPDLEQVFWSTSDPDILYYVADKDFVRYHVGAKRKEVMTTFSFCSDSASSGSDPMFTSFDSKLISLGCGNQAFIYDISQNKVIARATNSDENPPQMAPSGKFVYFSDSGRVADLSLKVVRTLDLAEPDSHGSLGILPNGEDVWNGVEFDPGPQGSTAIGSVISANLANGGQKVVVGEKTGFPYPPTTHVSSLAYRNPGWVVSSTLGDLQGKGLLDLELVLANVSSGKFCRIGRHRSWGKENTKIADSYWAEAHAVLSPSGTRIAFGSDWGNGTSVDTYVVELPSYKP